MSGYIANYKQLQKHLEKYPVEFNGDVLTFNYPEGKTYYEVKFEKVLDKDVVTLYQMPNFKGVEGEFNLKRSDSYYMKKDQYVGLVQRYSSSK